MAWLSEGELQADALADLNTKDNMLSVWQVSDDRANLEQIIAAIAATRDSISQFDYALLDQPVVPNIKIRHSKGNTADDQVNSWHHDLKELSATKLMELAQSIQVRAEIRRIPQKKILELVAQAVTAGRLDRTRLGLKLDQIRKVEEFIAHQ